MNRPGQSRRPAFGPLLTGTLLVFWTAGLSGLLLGLAPASLLAVHLTSAIGGMAVVALFLRLHWWLRRDKVASQPNAKWGYVALAAVATLFGSGVALLVWTNVAPLRWVHDIATAVLATDLAFHTAWRLRRRGLSAGRWPVLPRWLLPGALAAVLVAMVVTAGVALTEPSRAEPLPIAHASLAGASLPAAADCASCHSDIAAQWRVSAHANSATDPYYLGLTAIFAREQGTAAVGYCATCHNPVGLMQGEIDPKAAVPAGGTAYQERNTGVTLAMSPRAAEGVTCAICHQAAHAEPVNGQLLVVNAAGLLPSEPLAQLGLRAAPAAHRDAMLRPVIHQAALCGACHNLALPDGRKVEPTFDEWLASPYASESKPCQSCHFPEAAGRTTDSGLAGSVARHGGVPGAPSSLTDVANSTTLLEKAALLDVRIERVQDGIVAVVGVTNEGAGHSLPTGSDDLRQVWLEVIARDDAGVVIWQSGAIDRFGVLDPAAIRFGKVLGDAAGRPIALHRFWATDRVLEDTRIAPRERREARYSLPSTGLHSLTVRLLYQDVPRSFAEVMLDRSVSDLPVREMATAAVTWPEP
ncbi:MAG: hypothetical protein U0556_13665 [Dehalococcoidia bacterium]